MKKENKSTLKQEMSTNMQHGGTNINVFYRRQFKSLTADLFRLLKTCDYIVISTLHKTKYEQKHFLFSTQTNIS